MSWQKIFNKDFRGKWLVADGEATSYLSNLDGSSGETVKTGSLAVLSGYRYVNYTTHQCVYQLANNPGMGVYIINTDAPYDEWGWSGYDYGKTYSSKQAEDYISKLVSNQKHILENNLVCARFADKFNATQKKTLYNLQLRLAERDEKLQDSNYVSSATTSSPKGYNKLAPYLESFMASGGVGLVISTATIVVSAIVIALASTAAYYIYKYYYEQSEKDIKYSDELMTILKNKLTNEEMAKLQKETQGIVTKARFKASLGSYANVLKWGLLGIGGLVVYKLVRDKYKNRKR